MGKEAKKKWTEIGKETTLVEIISGYAIWILAGPVRFATKKRS
jgi:hypothetical protein